MTGIIKTSACGPIANPSGLVRLAAALVVCFVLMVGVVASAAQPINDRCPVTPEEPAEPHLTLDFEGRTIGFCCRSCIRQFRENPEAYRANLPPVTTAASAPPPEGSAHTGSPSSSLGVIDRGFRFAGNLHVLAIHFPIALLLIAALIEGLSWKWNTPQMRFASRLNFLFGAAGAVVAALLGWIAAANSHYTGDAAVTLEWHRWLGLTVALLALIGSMSLLAEKRGNPTGTIGYRTVLLLLVLLIPVTAHLGGTLIFGPNHLLP